jgi:hypothetical protein
VRRRDLPKSDEKISLELLRTRVLTLTERVHDLELEIRDLKIRFAAIEGEVQRTRAAIFRAGRANERDVGDPSAAR